MRFVYSTWELCQGHGRFAFFFVDKNFRNYAKQINPLNIYFFYVIKQPL